MSPTLPHRPLRVQSDARLLQLARRGEAAAFEALVRRYRRQLHGYCRRLGLGDAQAEDALQQGLLQAWRALLRGDDVRDVKSWMYRIVHNTALDGVRRTGNENVELDERVHGQVEASAAGELDRRLAVHATLTELAALPHMQREALVRTAVHGDSHEQVASALGLSHTAVRGLVHRARIAMRAAAGALLPERLLQRLVRWVTEAGSAGTTELGAGGAAGGIFGVLAKGGAILATGGILAGGIAAVQHSYAGRDRDVGQQAESASAAGAGRGGVSGYATGSSAAGENRLLASTERPKGEITPYGGAPHSRPPHAPSDHRPSDDRRTGSASTAVLQQKQAPVAGATHPPVSKSVSSADHPKPQQVAPATQPGSSGQSRQGGDQKTAHGNGKGHSQGGNSDSAEGGSSSSSSSSSSSERASGGRLSGTDKPGNGANGANGGKENRGAENRGANSSNAHIAEGAAKGHDAGASDGTPGTPVSSEYDMTDASSVEQSAGTQSSGSPGHDGEPQGRGLGVGGTGERGAAKEGSQAGSSKHGS